MSAPDLEALARRVAALERHVQPPLSASGTSECAPPSPSVAVPTRETLEIALLTAFSKRWSDGKGPMLERVAADTVLAAIAPLIAENEWLRATALSLRSARDAALARVAELEADARQFEKRRTDWAVEYEKLTNDNERLEKRVAALEGFVDGLGECCSGCHAIIKDRDVALEHIKTCARHPLSAALARIAALESAPAPRPIESAPRDGTAIHGIYSDGYIETIRWREERYCMLGSPQGSCGSGWVSDEAGGLPIDPPKEWRPIPPTAPAPRPASEPWTVTAADVRAAYNVAFDRTSDMVEAHGMSEVDAKFAGALTKHLAAKYAPASLASEPNDEPTWQYWRDRARKAEDAALLARPVPASEPWTEGQRALAESVCTISGLSILNHEDTVDDLLTVIANYAYLFLAPPVGAQGQAEQGGTGSTEGRATDRSSEVLKGSDPKTDCHTDRGSGCQPSSDHGDQEPSRRSSPAGIKPGPVPPAPSPAATPSAAREAWPSEKQIEAEIRGAYVASNRQWGQKAAARVLALFAPHQRGMVDAADFEALALSIMQALDRRNVDTRDKRTRLEVIRDSLRAALAALDIEVAQ